MCDKARTYTTTRGVEDSIADLLLGRFVGLVDAVGRIRIVVREVGIDGICLPGRLGVDV